MKTLILAAGRFGDETRARIAAGREPRLDVFELARVLDADVLDYLDVDRSRSPLVRLMARTAGPSAALAVLGHAERRRYESLFTTGEDIGLPLAALSWTGRERPTHTMIAHTLFPNKKRVFFQYAGAASRIDKILVYSTSEERLAKNELRIPEAKVERIYYHADQEFFRPVDSPSEPDLICAAGQLLRDYDCLIEATRDLPVRVHIAAGSPWIERPLAPRPAIPKNVTWQRLDRFELRALYGRAALAVVPILENQYQTGIATILEMMAMGKCVIATRTRGQTDTIVDGETGVYVPPSDPRALRDAITRLLAAPAEAARIGRAARRFMEEEAGLDRFVERVTRVIRGANSRAVGS